MKKLIGMPLLGSFFVICGLVGGSDGLVVSSTSPTEVQAKENSGWYLDALGVNEVRAKYSLTGKGVTIAVIDSGISFQDEALSKKVVAAYDFSEGLEQIDGKPLLKSDHGTEVASIIASDTKGIAPEVNLMDFNVALSGVENANLSGNGTVKAYQKILELLDSGVKIDIVQMSYGFEEPSERSQKLLAEIASRGVILVASSGNRAEEPLETYIQYPAAYDDVIAVGSITEKMVRAKSSSYGTFVDVAAPGNNIDVLLRDGTHAYASGTSMAAPMVSGILALYKEAYPSASSEELVQMLYENAKDLGSKGKDNEYGYGLVDALPPERVEIDGFIPLHNVFKVYDFANSHTSPSIEKVLNGEFRATKAKSWLAKEMRFGYYYLEDVGWVQSDETFNGLIGKLDPFNTAKVKVDLYDTSLQQIGYAAPLSEVCKLYVNKPEIEDSPSSSHFFGTLAEAKCSSATL